MKKILLIVAFLFSISALSFGQGTSPRGALATPDGSPVKVQMYATYDTAIDLSGKDTTYYAPGGRLGNDRNAIVHNFLHIKSAAGDTLYSSHCITIRDSTVNGIALASTDNYSYKGDRLTITFNTNGVGTKDTIFGYGAILFDTTGSGTNKALYVTKDLTILSHVVDLVFDGTNWVQIGPRTTGNRVGR